MCDHVGWGGGGGGEGVGPFSDYVRYTPLN